MCEFLTPTLAVVLAVICAGVGAGITLADLLLELMERDSAATRTDMSTSQPPTNPDSGKSKTKTD